MMSLFQNSPIFCVTVVSVMVLTLGSISVHSMRFRRDGVEIKTSPPVIEAKEARAEIVETTVPTPGNVELPKSGIETRSSRSPVGPARVASTTSAEFLEESLKLHNSLRHLHGVPELVLNNTLNEISQAYANKLATAVNEEPEHSPDLNTFELGENLYYSTSTKFGKTPNASKTITAWYNEINDYNFKTGEGVGDKPYLHFTQVVWKATTQLGIAYAETAVSNNKGRYVTHIVANYYPRGNFGDFKENVLPLLSDKKKIEESKKSTGKDEDESKKPTAEGEESKKSTGKGQSVSIHTTQLRIAIGCLSFYYLNTIYFL